jgi:type II secretory pathway component PulF
MIFSARIGQLDLANLCRRLATALESGVDARRVFAREATGGASGRMRHELEQVSRAVAQGESLNDALALTGDYFPPLFLEMVLVGEQTGHTAEVFKHLAEHYENQVKLRRTFLASVTMPMIQLTAALGIVGILIWIMGMIGVKDLTGKPVDMLGFGLMGTRGLLIYVGILATVAIVLYLTWQAMRRGMFWTRPLQYLILRVPVLGRALEVLALARLAWSLHLTFGTGMDTLKALPLCLRSMQNARYTDRIDEVVRNIRQGQEVSEVLAATGAFPPDFLDALEVGERSGRLPETMALLSEQYTDQAQRAMATLTVVAGFLVWAMVAALIVLLIFRIFNWYLGNINAALKF